MARAKQNPTSDSGRLTLSIPGGADRKCASQHFGTWSIEPKWFAAAIAAVRDGTLKPRSDGGMGDGESEAEDPGYRVVDGIAIISIDGQMTRRGSSFGGCSTIEVRNALRRAYEDFAVRGAMLYIDSPGGTTAGTSDLAEDVLAFRQGMLGGRSKPGKRCIAYIANYGCSAAYWVASQCETIYANTTALVGSIGTYCVLEDDSGAQELLGIKYRVIASARYKGLGADGKVTEELVSDVQREVNELNAPFVAAVAAGRGGRIKDVEAVADGRAHVSAQAKELGLIDEIASFDAALQAFSERTPFMNGQQFAQYAAEHPEDEAVKSLHAAGFKAGKAEGAAETRKEFAAYIAAANGNLDIATEAFAAGAGVEVVEARVRERQAAAARAKADADAQAKALAEKDAEIARLKAAQGTQGAVVTTGATVAAEDGKQAKEAPAAGKTPEEQAKAEWAAMSEEARLAWVGESAYVKVRADELK